MNPQTKDFIKDHHSAYLAIAAIILSAVVLYHEVQVKSFTQVNNKILKQVIEPPRAQ